MRVSLTAFCLLSLVAAARDGGVQAALDCHADILQEAVGYLKDSVHGGVLDYKSVPHTAKVPQQNVLARESTIVDASLTMEGAVAAALRLGFPATSTRVEPVLAGVIKEVCALGASVKSERQRLRGVIDTVCVMVEPLTRDLRGLVSKHHQPIAGMVDFGLVEVAVRVVQWSQANLVDFLIRGFDTLGVIPRAGWVNRPVVEPAHVEITRDDNLASFDRAVECLEKRARKMSPSQLLDAVAVWDSSVEECSAERNFCEGPLSRKAVMELFKECPLGPRCIPAFVLWQNGKLRRIDDALLSGHNERMCMTDTIVCVSATLPAEMAGEFAKHVPLECLCLRLGTDDIASAYRVVACSQPQYNIAAVWQPPERGGPGVKYFALRGFNFGLKCAPVHLATVLSPMVEFALKLTLVPCGRFYDDVVTVDMRVGGDSAQRSLEFLFRKIGYPFAQKKHEKLRVENPFLGICTSFANVAGGYVLLKVKEKRRRKLVAELRQVLADQKLSPAHAARLRGKLYFTTTSAFHGVGRAALHAFTSRQHAKRAGHKLNESLTQSLTFFIRLLDPGLPPHKYRLLPEEGRPLYVWSDAMWDLCTDEAGATVVALDDETGEEFYVADAAVAFTVYDPSDGTWHVSAQRIGRDVLRLMVPGKKTYIGQLEALAALGVLETLPPRITRGRAAIFWIDNLAAKYGLQKGYSKVDDSGRIINAFKVRQMMLDMRIWFEYVPSAQNIADLPSRGAFDKMYEVIESVSGSEWVSYTYNMAFGDFSSWTAPLETCGFRAKRKRSGSRGAAGR